MITNLKRKFAVSKQELRELFHFEQNAEVPVKAWLWLIGALISPFTVMGALIGYARAWNRFLKPEGIKPDLSNLTPIVRVSMLAGGTIGFLVGDLTLYSLIEGALGLFSGNGGVVQFELMFVLFGFILVEVPLISAAFSTFYQWQIGINNMLIESSKFGTARFATTKELQTYTNKKGIYIGGGYVFPDKGHCLTVAGTRGVKGTNLIIPNMLGASGYKGSIVCIDPKGENAAISARYRRQIGEQVIVLNPWGLFVDKIGEAQCYNPLDILKDKTSIHLVDDVQVVAEMLVPIEKDEKDRFFSDSSRSIVSGLLLHLMVNCDEKEQTLTTLWKWVRYKEDAWNNLLADMATCEDESFGETVRNSAGEILKLQQAGEKTFGNIIATVLQATDFLRSPALQKSLESGFSPYDLAEGKTTVYVIIPADKLQSHARWLRLVVTSTMRAVVRKPNKRVTFLLDEFSALGYMTEITTALSTYAGYEITVWAILQSLIQLKNMYGDGWETFIANCTIRQYASIGDNFSAEYISKAIGQASNVIITRSWFGIKDAKANPRALVTPDEVMRGSGTNIFGSFGTLPFTIFPKLPYYHMGSLIDNGVPRYDDNPYIKE